MSIPAEKDAAPASLRGGIGRFAPLIIFLAIAGVFFLMLTSGRNAQDIPSALAGKIVPAFSLPPVDGLSRNGAPVPGLSDADLKRRKVTVLNVFASWCGPCRYEHPQIVALAADPRVIVTGINHKDRPEDAKRFLALLGNPYTAVGKDFDRRVSIDFGVTMVPETFIIAGDGRVVFKKIGPISPEDIKSEIEPAIQQALK
jgi:cytochrome c biogenesis protein CcmG, thiol:disulfide interchange protein DsbE